MSVPDRVGLGPTGSFWPMWGRGAAFVFVSGSPPKSLSHLCEQKIGCFTKVNILLFLFNTGAGIFGKPRSHVQRLRPINDTGLFTHNISQMWTFLDPPSPLVSNCHLLAFSLSSQSLRLGGKILVLVSKHEIERKNSSFCLEARERKIFSIPSRKLK